jgi:cytochrome b6-f complex iron-sulfur subunit
LTATMRFMFPNVLFEPPTVFKAGLPESYKPGEVDERYKDKYGVWVVRTEDNQIYVLSTVCTHLGCPPNWLPAEQKFKCPCHGVANTRAVLTSEVPRHARSNASACNRRRRSDHVDRTGNSSTRRASGRIRSRF